MFAFQDTRGAVDVAFTDRHGGISARPYASLNLGGNGEHPHTVDENIGIVAYAFARGYQTVSDDSIFALPDGTAFPMVVDMRQVHGADVHVVDEPYVAAAAAAAGAQPGFIGDALVTRETGIVLMVRSADCAPVILADTEQGVVGAAHAGRMGLVAGVVPATIERMRDLGARRINAWVGPHVCGRCYEVPEQMRAEIAAAVPESHAETSWGSPAVDLGAGLRAQLDAYGVESTDVAGCTMEDEDLYSYRRQGKASGRQAGLVWIRP